MILKKVYISSFGKLKNFSYEFSDGFNQINEDNGWGKTTLATFIKCMFYGIDDGRKSLVNGSERKKFKPWNSTEKFGGYVEFIWGNDAFRLERYFGNKESDDTVKIYDFKSGKEKTASADLGKRIFSVDEEGFLSSVFFSQNDLDGKVSASLTEKFNSGYGNDSQSVNDAINRVDAEMKGLKALRGDKGKIAELKNKIFEIDSAVNTCKKAQETFYSVQKEVKELEKECENINNEISLLSAKLELSANAEAIKLKKERIENLGAKIDSLKTEIKRTEQIFIGGKPTDDELEAYRNCYKELVSVNENIDLIKHKIAAFSEVSAENAVKNTKFSSSLIIVLAALFAVFAATGVIIFSSNKTVSVVLFVLSGICAIGAVLLLFVNKSKKNSGLKAIENNVNIYKKQLTEYESVADVYVKKLDAFFAKTNLPPVSYGEKFNAISNAFNDLLRLNAELNAYENQFENYSADSDLSSNYRTNAEDFNQLKSKLSLLRERYSVKSGEYAEKRASLKILDEKASNLPDYANRLNELTEELKKTESDYKILSFTKEFLGKANEEIISKYRSPMQESLKKYLKLIDDKNGFSGSIDVELKLTVIDNEDYHDTVYYSKGLRYLFEICKRFAFIDVLFDKDKPFIILDDPFCNFDQSKIKNGINLLKKLSAEYQIIYFICHNSRGE